VNAQADVSQVTRLDWTDPGTRMLMIL